MRFDNLYNPFTQIAGYRSLIIGFIVFLLTTYLAYITGTHFYGLLNIDFARDSGYWLFLIEHLSNWLLISIFMYISGLMLSKSRIRVIDIMGTTLFARIPLIIAPLIRLIPVFQSFGFQSWEMYSVKGFYLLSLVWTLVLLLNACKISCNLKNERLIITFIISMILSEVCSKFVIISLT